MARPLFGGTDRDFLAAAGSTTVYSSPALTTAVTDLMTVVYTSGSPAPGSAITAVTGDDYKYYAFYAPDAWTGPLWAPKAYTPSGLPDASKGALRLDPWNPTGGGGGTGSRTDPTTLAVTLTTG